MGKRFRLGREGIRQERKLFWHKNKDWDFKRNGIREEERLPFFHIPEEVPQGDS